MALTDDELLVRNVRGFAVPSFPIIDEKAMEFAMDYKPGDNDVILNAFVRTGSTWVLYLVWQILHKAEKLCVIADIPIIEIAGEKALESLTEPRFYKCHLSHNAVRTNKKSKYIYVHRKPEDVLSSYYHLMREMSNADFDFDSFFEAFMGGRVAYGDYLDHVIAAHSHVSDGNILIVAYESVKKDTRGEVLRIAEYLGEEYYEPLKKDECLLQKILDISTFEYMKKHIPFPLEVFGQPGKVAKYYRTGGSGDGKKHLSEEQRKRLKEKIQDKIKGTELLDLWAS